jgi:hypothetical protein
MATIKITDRARILMDLIKDGTVADSVPYDSVDKMAAAKAIEIAQNFWDQYGQQVYEIDGTTPRNPKNAELATFFVNTLRDFCRGTRKANRVKAAAATAHAAEAATVDGENDTDFGKEE